MEKYLRTKDNKFYQFHKNIYNQPFAVDSQNHWTPFEYVVDHIIDRADTIAELFHPDFGDEIVIFDNDTNWTIHPESLTFESLIYYNSKRKWLDDCGYSHIENCDIYFFIWVKEKNLPIFKPVAIMNDKRELVLV